METYIDTTNKEYAIQLKDDSYIEGKPIFSGGCFGVIPSNDPEDVLDHVIILNEDDGLYRECAKVRTEDLRKICAMFYVLSSYIKFTKRGKFKFPRGRIGLYRTDHSLKPYTINIEDRKPQTPLVTIKHTKGYPYYNDCFSMYWLEARVQVLQDYFDSLK